MHKKFLFFLLFISFISMFFMTGCSQKRIDYTKISATKFTSVARHKATLKPYVIKGKRYTPTFVRNGSKQYGISSWYGPNFHGKHTSNGEVYNMHARTAAHKTFPMDTIVRVKNLENGTSTVVRINDRGPFVSGRIIDCSYRAGKELGLDQSGIARVEVTVLGVAKSSHKISNQKQAIIQKIKYRSPKRASKPILLGIQLGAYKNVSGAHVTKRKYTNRYVGYRPIIKKHTNRYGITLYKVWLIGFKTMHELKAFKEQQSRLAERI